MKVGMRLGVLAAAMALCPGLLLGDWSPGDPYKMHFPQLPDPIGWDVNVTAPNIVADDWLCTESGPVSDAHLWISFSHDAFVAITSVHLSIHADIPDPDGPGPQFSMPGPPLWQQDFTNFSLSGPWPGQQGWYDPVNTNWSYPDHFTYGQINIQDIQDPFIQTNSTIYWLDVSIGLVEQPGAIGWKTSTNHWNDDAVYWDPQPGSWKELRDPISGESLDMAFVITSIPEPGTFMLFALAVPAILGRLRRRA